MFGNVFAEHDEMKDVMRLTKHAGATHTYLFRNIIFKRKKNGQETFYQDTSECIVINYFYKQNIKLS
jgi:hypothetical protein